MEAVQAHMYSILGDMGDVERYLLICESKKANSSDIHSAVSSIADITRNAVYSSAAFSVSNGDVYLVDTHRSLAEFHGLAVYLESLSHLAAKDFVRLKLEEFQFYFSAWVQTLQNTCEIFGFPSEVHERMPSELEHNTVEGVS